MQPHTWQQIKVQCTSWGQGCSPLLLLTPFYSGVTLLYSGSLCSCSAWSLTNMSSIVGQVALLPSNNGLCYSNRQFSHFSISTYSVLTWASTSWVSQCIEPLHDAHWSSLNSKWWIYIINLYIGLLAQENEQKKRLWLVSTGKHVQDDRYTGGM